MILNFQTGFGDIMSAKKNADNEAGLPAIAIAAIVVAVIAIVAFVVMSGRQKFEPMAPGAQALDFTLPDLNGKQVSLKDYRGKVVFLNFWATWCKPCGEEMPSMQGLHNYLQGQPFEILAVSVDKDDPKVVAEFAKANNLTFPILLDGKGKIKELYKTTGVPETFIIDQNGIVAEKVWGPRDWADPASNVMLAELLRNGPKNPDAYKKGAAKH